MILRAWSGALVDTAEYKWTIWPRWAMGWLRYVLTIALWGPARFEGDDDGLARCRARSEAGLRCWERQGHHRPHGQQRRSGEWVRWVETPTHPDARW